MSGNVIRFRSLEGARAVAALWVVFGHLFLLARFPAKDLIWPLNIIAQPVLAVYVFMILSGFVISHLIVFAKEPYSTYIFRRWLRLFPLLFVSVSFVVLFFLLAPKISPFRYNYDLLLPYVIAHLMMMHGVIPSEILPNSPVALIGTAWSISTEWQFYLIAPLVVGLLIKKHYYTFSMLIIISFLISGSKYSILGYSFTFPRGAFLPNLLWYFMIGVGSYFCISALRTITISTGTLFCIVAATFLVTKSYPLTLWVFLFIGLTSSPAAINWLAHPWLIWLGDRSYSIYLTHMIVLMMVRSYFVNPHFEQGTIEYLIALSALTVPLTILVSAATYRWVELPAIRFGKNMQARRKGHSESVIAAE